MQTTIHLPLDAITAFCERHHILRFSLFGSILREDFGPESDIVVLVEFDPDHIPGLTFFSMADELAEILGRPVDLGTPNSLNRHIRDRVLASTQIIYERPGR